MSIKGIIDKWRHSRGYGVHSPLAFRMVTEVVRPKKNISYYGYEKLEAFAREYDVSRRDERRARLLLRLTADIEPAYVWVTGKLPEIYMEAIRLSGNVIRIFTAELYPKEIERADLIVTWRDMLTVKQLKEVRGSMVTIVGFDVTRSFINRVASNVGNAVTLDAGDSFITLCRQGLSAVIYNLRAF